MIIYSIHITIPKNIIRNWENWMQATHIPDVMKTGMFLNFKFNKSENIRQQEVLYIIQYTSSNISQYLNYKTRFATELQNQHNNKFKNQFSAKRELFIKIR